MVDTKGRWAVRRRPVHRRALWPVQALADYAFVGGSGGVRVHVWVRRDGQGVVPVESTNGGGSGVNGGSVHLVLRTEGGPCCSWCRALRLLLAVGVLLRTTANVKWISVIKNQYCTDITTQTVHELYTTNAPQTPFPKSPHRIDGAMLCYSRRASVIRRLGVSCDAGCWRPTWRSATR